MKTAYDVIIIGAGPAGSTCAYTLKRINQKLRILLLDQSSFPRYKPCGGGVSPEVQDFFDFDLHEAIDTYCHEISISANGQTSRSKGQNVWMVRREIFDNFLVNKARQKNVDILMPCKAQVIEEDEKEIRVQTTSGKFSTQIVVLAEGGKGSLARKHGFSNNKFSMCAAMEYEHYTQPQDEVLQIDFNHNDKNHKGYAWCFPKSDGLSLGIASLVKGNPKHSATLPTRLKNYLKEFQLGKIYAKHSHGHPIKLYRGKSKTVKGRIVLIGEAANCVDPLTGEGIRPAIKSGYLAAEILAQAFQKQDIKIVQKYNQTFHDKIGRNLQYARVLSWFSRYMYNSSPPTSSSINKFMKIFNGESSYQEKLKLSYIGKLLYRTIRSSLKAKLFKN